MAGEVIHQYSLRKINALYKAAVENQEDECRMMGVAVRYGTNATVSEFERWLKGNIHG